MLARHRFDGRASPGQVAPTGSFALYEQAAGLVPMGAWSCDLRTDGLAWTRGVFDLFGLPRDAQVERRDIVEMYSEDAREVLERRRSRAIATRGGFTLDASIVRPDGAVRWMRITAATQVSNGRSVALYGMKQDITEDHLRWEALRARAECDALTGVANRARFQSEFLGQPRHAPALAGIGALVRCAMDGFQSVHDRWGHAAGDACLSIFARRLKAAFADATLVARIGGDEFAVLLPSTGARSSAEAAIRRKVLALHAPAEWHGHVLPLGVSAGLAFADATPDFDPQELFVAADRALYQAKRDPLTPLNSA
jgi:diguanylate cyclase (GGDEF)-like protein/PAS domain S-box-containing protein